MYFGISSEPIDCDAEKAKVATHASGGYVSFEGWVRNHNEGSRVSALEYEVYHALAQSEGELVLKEAMELFDIEDVACIHREGHLDLGDCAVWIGISSAHRDAAYRANRYVIDEIKKRLPIWKKEHYIDRPAEWVNCKRCATQHHHGIAFKPEEFYSRQLPLPNSKNLRIAVIGAGALGSACLPLLAHAGIGKITIYDHDKLEVSNLHRQTLYSFEDIGHFKSVLAKQRLISGNPFIDIVAKVEKLTQSNVEEIVGRHDILINCTDNIEVQYLLNDACFFAKKIIVSAAIFQWQGTGQVINFNKDKSPCIRCSVPEEPDQRSVMSCDEAGVVATVSAMVGAWQAQQVVNILRGVANDAHVLFDAESFQMRSFGKSPNPECPLCGDEPAIKVFRERVRLKSQVSEISWDQFQSEKLALVDLRTKEEVTSQPLPRRCGAVVHIDELGEQENWEALFDKTEAFAVFCTRGIRSAKKVAQLQNLGFENARSIRGGIQALDF